ncbi:DUF3108 domain-containing protein [Gilvimarinus sp. F26214L]|uniref:DUF3108 domain-containing protein n=1 Tax=Gilvimarinus sp. DZF01 TaxID=3461371 RepID=UPI004045CC61
MKSALLHKVPAAACLLLFSLLAQAAPATQPKNFEATYKAKYFGISVTATRKLETLGDGSRLFTFFADSWLADLKEVSQFRWADADRIQPLRYVYERSGLGRDRELVVDFDWDKRQVVNDASDKPWRMEVPAGALDKLSWQLQIRTDLLNGRPLLEYDVADGGSLKQYSFEVLGEEEVDTDAGRFKAVKVKRLRDEDAERHTIFWMAKEWDYLVVRLLQKEEDGANYEIDLHRAVLDGKEVRGL